MTKNLRMAATVILVLAMTFICCACGGKQELVDMSTSVNGEYAAIVWGDKTYVPYGALSAYGDRGKQIGIVDGDENHKVYECKGYSSDEWIVAALPHDAAMLYKEIDATDIPKGWQSEYEWNK